MGKSKKVELKKVCYPCPFYNKGVTKLSPGKCKLFGKDIWCKTTRKEGRYFHERLKACKISIKDVLIPENMTKAGLNHAIEEWRKELNLEVTDE